MAKRFHWKIIRATIQRKKHFFPRFFLFTKYICIVVQTRKIKLPLRAIESQYNNHVQPFAKSMSTRIMNMEHFQMQSVFADGKLMMVNNSFQFISYLSCENSIKKLPPRKKKHDCRLYTSRATSLRSPKFHEPIIIQMINAHWEGKNIKKTVWHLCVQRLYQSEKSW